METERCPHMCSMCIYKHQYVRNLSIRPITNSNCAKVIETHIGTRNRFPSRSL